MDLVLKIGVIGTYIVAGLLVSLRAIAPLTKWTGDDKAVGFLEKVEAILTKIFVPSKHLKSGDKK